MSINGKLRVSLNRDLRKKYGVRSFPIAKGDIVTIKSGGRKGEGGKVLDVNHKDGRVSIEGITIAKADGKAEEYFIATNILQITKLELSRPERLQKLRELASRKNIVVEEEPEPAPAEAEEEVSEGAAKAEGEEEEEAEEAKEEELSEESEESEEEFKEEEEEIEGDEVEEADEEEPEEMSSDDQ